MKKYYSFGGQTVAMKEGTTFKYFLSDHLGSTSLVLSATGTILEQQRYLPFGQPRAMSPAIISTDFTYTGQRALPDTGLMDYKARFYSPTLGRFIQPDTMIPGAANPQSWNRYTYGANNPIRYGDPSGHMASTEDGGGIPCIPGDLACQLKKGGGTPTYGNYDGKGVDELGVWYARRHVESNNAIVAAGIAVQSQWYIPGWDTPLFSPASQSYGLAQATEDELKGRDPMDPAVAVAVMTERINGAVNKCIERKLCRDETDNFIVAALAQNGVNPNGWLDVVSLPPSEGGGIDWDYVMTNQGKASTDTRVIDRQKKSGMNYNTQFMLNLFTHDIRALMSAGYKLPEQYDEVNWGTIDDLINK